MLKKLVPHGNSAALIIDKPIMELLRIDMETPLDISTDGQSLRITPVRSTANDEEVRRALKHVMKKHRKTLKRLAE